ncbi:MAG: hypothetical protein KKC55_16600 [Gammaproteobacteria bacterium]|uniref:Uncharacterized protein n=1 Tax=viral metagenome TaxID=1070528 RepID=A0A6M3M0I2_9ZZZZ|nr:hypothetical protein [Gammaproteobacteria bacterium]
MKQIPARGTIVRRKRDGKLYTVGTRHTIGFSAHVRLHPVWDGKSHDKREDLFLEQYDEESSAAA